MHELFKCRYYPLDSEATPDPKNKSLNFWMQTPLNVSWLQERQLPITSAFAARSSKTGGTVAEYIREHLGYRLELVSARVEWRSSSAIAGAIDLSLSLALTNNGFAAPVNARLWTVLLLDVVSHAPVVNASLDPSAAQDWRTFYPVVPGDPLCMSLTHSVTLGAAYTSDPIPRIDFHDSAHVIHKDSVRR
jgi:hypothetical protein